jgi:hypothetical protein
MKKLSRDEMKNVMGGNAPVWGCYARCADGPLESPHTSIGTFPVASCVDVSCFGGPLVSCSCSLYPA